MEVSTLSVLWVVGAAAVAILGAFLLYALHRARPFRGHSDFRGQCVVLAKALRADVRRDQQDLVIQGHYANWPAALRFSQAEDDPAVVVSLRAPATFRLAVLPQRFAGRSLQALVRSPQASFDAKFVTSVDDRRESKLFLSDNVWEEVQKLCCSSDTALSVTPGQLELAELSPTNCRAAHIANHLKSLAYLADRLSQIPGADRLKIEPFPTHNKSGLWLCVAALVLFILTLGYFVAANKSERTLAIERQALGT